MPRVTIISSDAEPVVVEAPEGSTLFDAGA